MGTQTLSFFETFTQDADATITVILSCRRVSSLDTKRYPPQVSHKSIRMLFGFPIVLFLCVFPLYLRPFMSSYRFSFPASFPVPSTTPLGTPEGQFEGSGAALQCLHTPRGTRIQSVIHSLYQMGVRPYLWVVMVIVVTWAGSCRGHARLIEPPSRASAWRYGFDTPADYNDNEGFLWRFQLPVSDAGRQMWHLWRRLGRGPTPARGWGTGQVIPVVVDVTANHRGYFEFRICPNNNPSVEASQTCLNEHPLYSADGSVFQHYIDTNLGEHTIDLRLPADVSCTQCVLQWRYVSGNNWGVCEDGTGAVGCGPQEEFRACADVAITRTGESVSITSAPPTAQPGTSPSTFTTNNGGTTTTTKATTTTTTTTTTTQGGSGVCRPVGVWQTVPGMDEWCVNNCNHTPPYCPPSHCTCD
ncbi:hypothetical protein O3P69_008771 [Scylla paramamosain]|uniref:Chitin-binding type-4 domain-containing protein n=1 Tax=Scylla paramamosain TaxID=85552 RepID=A0AAW0SN31_SCYPA